MGGFLRSVTKCALGGLALLAVSSASATTIPIVPGTTMEVEAPAGQCMIDPSASQIDAAYFATMQKLYTGSNQLLAYFIPCDALASMRQGVAQPMSEWTIVLLPLSNGQPTSGAGYTRAQALDELAKTAGGDSLQGYLDGQRSSIESRVAQAIRQDQYQVSQLKSLGLLARDDSALYSGLLMTQVIGGVSQNIACVFAMSLVNGYVVTVNIYRPYESPQTFSGMVDVLKAQMGTLIAANGGQPAAASASFPDYKPPPPTFGGESPASGDEASMALVVGGGLAVVLIGGLVGYFLTRRKTGQG